MSDAVVIERDPRSETGWTATWLREEDGRVVIDTTTPVEPQQVVDAIDCLHIEESLRLRLEGRRRDTAPGPAAPPEPGSVPLSLAGEGAGAAPEAADLSQIGLTLRIRWTGRG